MEKMQYILQNIRHIVVGSPGEIYGGFVETHTLIFVRNGAGYLYLDGAKHSLKAKSIGYCPPGAIVDIREHAEGEAVLELYELQYQVWELEERNGNRVAYGKRTGEMMDSGKLPCICTHESLSLLQELYDRWLSPGPGSSPSIDFRLDSMFKQILYVLFRPSEEQEQEEEWHARIRHAVEHMERHFTQPISRSDMAKRVGLTPEHFSISFKRVMGVGFSEHLTRLRIDKAKETLLRSDSNLDQVAREVGYRDGLYLSRKFKQQTGVSPRDYIRRPKRIVALQYVGHLLALGLKPVGSTGKHLHALPYRGLLEDVADVGNAMSLEAIADLKPDLIITSRPNSEPLSQLATTIAIPWGQQDSLDQLLMLGKTLGRMSEAEQWIEEFKHKEEKAATLVASHIKPGSTAVVFEFWSDRIWAVNIGYGRGLRNLYKTFSFRPPEALAPYVLGEGVGLELSPGTLADYTADYIFVTIWEEQGGSVHAERIMASAEWKQLEAVRNGRIYPINLELFKYNDPIALEQQLFVQTELLTKVHAIPHIRK